MGFNSLNGLRYYQFDSFKGQPVFHAILTRHGGVSQPPFDQLNTGGTVGDDPQAVLENHQRIYAAFGFAFNSRFDVWQVHGSRVLCADSPRGEGVPHPKADGILTQNPDVTLFMRFADCVPILLLDPVNKAIGIVHAGWQGTYKKIAQIAVEQMSACFGSQPGALFAGIGPSICQQCYQVGPEVLEAFERAMGTSAEGYFAERGGHLHLDLWRVNQDILQLAGVQKIETAGICTACHLEDWYSHRAEHGKTGRFAVIMHIEDQIK
jgi:polyphenol oxidase